MYTCWYQAERQEERGSSVNSVCCERISSTVDSYCSQETVWNLSLFLAFPMDTYIRALTAMVDLALFHSHMFHGV